MKFSEEQIAYFQSKAISDIAEELASELAIGLDWDSDAEVEAFYSREDVNKAWGVRSKANRALRIAEDRMMDWALEKVKRECAGRPGLGLVVRMHEKMKKNVAIRQKVIALAIRLAV